MREFELALLWLQDCGLLYQVRRVSSPSLPLAAYQDLKAFKLFLWFRTAPMAHQRDEIVKAIIVMTIIAFTI